MRFRLKPARAGPQVCSQSLADRFYCDDRHLHGGARQQHRQCRAAAYSRQPVGYRRPGYLGVDVAVGGYGTQALLYDLRGALHGLFISLQSLPRLGCSSCFACCREWRGRITVTSEQAILADTFPPQRLGMAFAIYGMAVVLAPSIGPTLGGWITDNYSWRWIFYINVPIGIISLLLTNHFVQDPDYLKEHREEQRRSHRRLRIDYIGIGLIALGIGCLQVVLDKGQEDDWFASHFIAVLSAVSLTSIVALVIWELRQRSPVKNCDC